ncbi:MAG: helix-turn-helix domain-containing protein [Chitinophagaceae bacterium]|nr:helix-turn-helix domain-containing protein [Chitinophagaceae bacterium]
MKTYSLEHVKDKFIGAKGTPKRNVYENELRLDLLGEKIRQTRIKKNLTQEQLGQLVGVQKAQISKIENNFKDTRISTILKVFDALETRILLKIIKQKKVARFRTTFVYQLRLFFMPDQNDQGS